MHVVKYSSQCCHSAALPASWIFNRPLSTPKYTNIFSDGWWLCDTFIICVYLFGSSPLSICLDLISTKVYWSEGFLQSGVISKGDFWFCLRRNCTAYNCFDLFMSCFATWPPDPVTICDGSELITSLSLMDGRFLRRGFPCLTCSMPAHGRLGGGFGSFEALWSWSCLHCLHCLHLMFFFPTIFSWDSFFPQVYLQKVTSMSLIAGSV